MLYPYIHIFLKTCARIEDFLAVYRDLVLHVVPRNAYYFLFLHKQKKKPLFTCTSCMPETVFLRVKKCLEIDIDSSPPHQILLQSFKVCTDLVSPWEIL